MSPSYLDIIVAREQYQERLWNAQQVRRYGPVNNQSISKLGLYSKAIAVIEFVTLWLVYS
jgi:hypothetical protein